MIPATQGAAAWFASLFGGTGTPTTTSMPAADTPQEWTSFASFLQSGMNQPLPTPNLSLETTEDTESDDTEAKDADAFGATVVAETPIVSATIPAGGDKTILTDESTTAASELEAVEVTADGESQVGTPSGPTGAEATETVDTALDEGAESVRDAMAMATGSTVSREPVASADAAFAESDETTATFGTKPVDEPTDPLASDGFPISRELGLSTEDGAITTPTASQKEKGLVFETSTTTERPSTDGLAEVAIEDTRSVREDLHAAQAAAPVDVPTPAPAAPEFAAANPTNPQRGTTITADVISKTLVAEAAHADTDDVAVTNDAARDALARMRVTRKDQDTPRESVWAREVGARLAVREATVPTSGSDGVAGDEGPTPVQAPRESITETIVDEMLEDEAAHDGGSPELATKRPTAKPLHEDEVRVRTRSSATPAPETTPASAPVAPTEAPEAPSPVAETSKVDLGARLREAIVETLAAEARDELLASVQKGGWEAKVTVDPVSLGRVDVQVTQTTRGLEIILAAAHEEAARMLDAEVDDLVDELVRRDLEPGKVTVRTHEGGQETDRNARNAQEQASARARQRETDEATEDDARDRGSRGRDREPLREREAQG